MPQNAREPDHVAAPRSTLIMASALRVDRRRTSKVYDYLCDRLDFITEYEILSEDDTLLMDIIRESRLRVRQRLQREFKQHDLPARIAMQTGRANRSDVLVPSNGSRTRRG